MKGHRTTDGAMQGCSALRVCGGSSLGTPRAAMSEVQISGIPKLSVLEVASTP